MRLYKPIRRPLAVLSVLMFCSLAAPADCVAGTTTRPNLVVFISDDHGFGDSSVAGAREFRTPHLERLAANGMTFTHAFAASPTCAPSRAALLTGWMPARNGAMLNHQPPHREIKKLPAYLQELGYEVVAFGKVAHYKQGADYGFDHVSHDDFHEDDCIDAAVEFLNDRVSEKRLCLLVGTNWPHVPWPEASGRSADEFVPPRSQIDTPATRAWRARYAAAVERADDDLGRVYDAAFETLGANTLFLHFSDHGAQWPLGKWNLYDAGTHVPLFAVWPGVIRPRSRSTAMLSLVDVLPTLIEVAGGRPPAQFDGESFAGVFKDPRRSHREFIFTTHSGDGRMNAYPMRSIRTRRWKYIRNLRPESKHTTHIDQGNAIDGKLYWKSWLQKAEDEPAAAEIIRRYHHRPAEELYDLEADPQELRNLASDPDHEKPLTRLRLQLDDWMRRQGDHGLVSEEAIQTETTSIR
jgi:uncharacterized sulfatase